MGEGFGPEFIRRCEILNARIEKNRLYIEKMDAILEKAQKKHQKDMMRMGKVLWKMFVTTQIENNKRKLNNKKKKK